MSTTATTTAPITRTLVEELDLLHASYAAAVNDAVAADDFVLAEELAASYDADAVRLIAEREGRTDLLPLFGQRVGHDSRLRRAVGRLAHLRRHAA